MGNVPVTPYPPDSRLALIKRQALNLWIIGDLQPVSVLSSSSFISVAQALDPRFQIISEYTFLTDDLPAMELAIDSEISASFTQSEAIAITADCWTKHGQPWIVVTGHFIKSFDGALSLTTQCLGISYFPGAHTGESIAAEVNDVLTRYFPAWKEQKVVSCVTTDGAANMRKYGNMVEHKLLWFRCFAHLLHLIAMEFIETSTVKEIIKKVHDLGKSFKYEKIYINAHASAREKARKAPRKLILDWFVSLISCESSISSFIQLYTVRIHSEYVRACSRRATIHHSSPH